jgi:hypothetical protein
MIKRRLRDRLKQHDWVGVTIELALVIVGVFLGIQVANWNEQRKEGALERAYVARIAQDVQSDVAELDEVIRVSAVRMGLLNELLPKASGQALPDGFNSARGRVGIELVPAYDNSSHTSAGFTLFILTPLDGNRSGYATMVNTGAIAGMTDIAMLRKIQDYYSAVDREMHFEVALEQNRDKFIDAQRKAGISPVKMMSADQLAAQFAANPELLATAENYWLYTNRHIKLTRELQRQARNLADYLSTNN